MNAKAKKISTICALALAIQLLIQAVASLLLNKIIVIGAEYYLFRSAIYVLTSALPMAVIVFLMKKNRISAPPLKKFCTRGEIILSVIGASALIFAFGLVYKKVFPSVSEGIPLTLNSAPHEHLLAILSFVLFPALLEEMFFRGCVARYASVAGRPVAIIVSALSFALVQYSSTSFPYAFVTGLFLGTLYFQTGKLKYAVISHFLVRFTEYMFTVARLLLSPQSQQALEITTFCAFTVAGMSILISSMKKISEALSRDEGCADATAIITPALAIYVGLTTVAVLF